MKPNKMTGRKAAAALLIAALIPMASATPEAEAAAIALRPCEDNKDPGFGGAEIQCQRPCEEYSVLSIHVYSHDGSSGGYASVGGTFECGGTDATCSKAKECYGTSPKLTSASETNGACSGFSDEFFNSKLDVDCTYEFEGPGINEWCPIVKPVETCIQPDPFGGRSFQDSASFCAALDQLIRGPTAKATELQQPCMSWAQGTGGGTSLHWDPGTRTTSGYHCAQDLCTLVKPEVLSDGIQLQLP